MAFVVEVQKPFISAIDVMDHVCVCDIDGTTDTSRLRKPRDE